jgi:predicted nucleic acid-binding protein
MFLIDTNVLVYAFDISEPRKRKKCKPIIERIFKGEEKGCISVQNLSEFYITITRKVEKPVREDKAEEIVRGIILSKNWRTLGMDENSILLAIEISRGLKISYWDSLIVAVMQQNNIRKIYTENEKDFKKVKWLEVRNPLR